MANCQENPTFRDKYGNDCNFYKKYPEMCAESIYSANDQGQTAQMACCTCSGVPTNVPQALQSVALLAKPTESEPAGFTPENPCPLNQVWGGVPVDGRRIEVGTASMPYVDVYGEAVYWKSGEFSLVMDLTEVGGEKKGCWRPVAPDNSAVFTCNSDDYCKNLDLAASTPGNLVYKCPQATCNIGNCYCGPDCMKDDVTKICVRRSREINKSASINVRSPWRSHATQSVVPTPPLNVCVPTEVAERQYVCWKRTRNFDSSGNPHDSLVDCDPNFCGFANEGTKTIKLAGSLFSLFTKPSVREAKVENFSDTAAPTTAAPTTAAPTTAAPTTATTTDPSTIIIIIILSIIVVILLGIFIQYLRTSFGGHNGGRSHRFG